MFIQQCVYIYYGKKQTFDRNAYYRNYYKNNPEQDKKHKALIKKERLEIRLESKKKIGNKCIICGSHERLSFHEINGKPHYIDNHYANEKYYLENWQDFVPLCLKHHSYITRFAKSLHSEVELDKAVELIKKLMANKRSTI